MTESETNKQVVLDWIGAVNRGDEQAILEMVSDDFVFRTMARSPEWIKYRWNKHEFAAVPKAQSTLMEAPIRMEVVRIFGEGDQVVLEAVTDAMLKNGKHYDNAYSLMFQFDDGKITEVREYSCSHLVVQCFGEFNPNNPNNPQAPVADAPAVS